MLSRPWVLLGICRRGSQVTLRLAIGAQLSVRTRETTGGRRYHRRVPNPDSELTDPLDLEAFRRNAHALVDW